MPAAKPSKARVAAALEAAISVGVQIGELRILPDGTIRLFAEGSTAGKLPGTGGDNSCDALFGAAD